MTACSQAEFVSVSVRSLMPASLVGVSLYLPANPGERPRLYRAAGYPLAEDDLELLNRKGIKRLLMSAADQDVYQGYLREQLSQVTASAASTVEQRVSMLNEVARAVLSEAFRRRDMQEIVGHAETIGRHTATLLSGQPVMADDLMRVLDHDSHTFTHCANVSYFSVLLARGLGIRDEDDLTRIATGGLLHDIGKLQIPHSILTKPGRLTRDEFDVVKRHPTDGFRLLGGRESLSFGQLMMVYQHHERRDGTGYPVGVIAEEIHPWAMICAVADVFEALTSRRSYRPGLTADEALAIIERTVGPRFDPEVYECWKSIINKR